MRSLRTPFWNDQTGSPRLLVSVRNATEAVAAMAGGCDIVDIKEPRNGALGMASVADILAVIEIVRASCSAAGPCATGTKLRPVSAALGEAVEWIAGDRAPASSCDAAPCDAVPCDLDYFKLGTAGLDSSPAWRQRWNAARAKVECALRGGEHRPEWIAVAYADWQTARGPEPVHVLEAAAEDRCAGMLIDTHSKGTRGLFDWIDSESLARLSRQAAQYRMPLAIAGRLRISDLPRLADIGCEIVGIRTAACCGADRDSPIDADAVCRFKAGLLRTCGAINSR